MTRNAQHRQTIRLARAGAAFALTFGIGISLAALLGVHPATGIAPAFATSALVAFYAHRAAGL